MHMLAHTVGETHPRTLDAMHQVGVVLQAQGRHADAADMHLHALGRQEELFGVDSAPAASSLVHVANAREAQGKTEEALSLRRRRLALALGHYPEGHTGAGTPEDAVRVCVWYLRNVAPATPLRARARAHVCVCVCVCTSVCDEMM